MGVAAHQIGSMDKQRLAKIGAALIPGSSSIICVFDEVLVKESDYADKMQDHQAEMQDLTDHVVTKITEQLRAGCDVAFHIVVDEQSGDISWTRTVVGEDAIQVLDIVMSHDSLAVEEVTTTTIGMDENNKKKEETTETGVIHERNDGTQDVIFERSTVQANSEAT